MDKILLMSLGSRGDMEPFLALGQELQDAGHEIAFCMPDQFRTLAAEVSPNFYPMDRAFIELVESPEVKKITGQIGSGLSRIKTILKLLRETKPIQQQLIRDQKFAVESFAPDNIIYHIKCVYPVMAAMEFGQRVELLSPVPCLVHPVDHEPAIGFGAPHGRWWNRLTYTLSNNALIRQAIIAYGGPLAKEWGMKPLQKKAVKTFLMEQLPVEFAVSEQLFPQPTYWPEHVRVTGFRERPKTAHWSPSAELLAFLEVNPEPLYVGFGSMINGRPEEIGRIIVETTSRLGVPVLINTSWGGIELPTTLPDHVFAVDNIPFDWLFSRVRAVVHHGGSGTTHSALNFELKQLIIPHIGDQFLWNRLIHKAGMGPLGVPIKKLDKSTFSRLLGELLK